LASKQRKLLLLLPLATKLGTFHWPPSFRSTFTPFSFFLKANLDHGELALVPGHNLQLNLEYLFPQAS
jgi:hypothetical protein